MPSVLDNERAWLISVLGLTESAAAKMSIADLRNSFYSNPPTVTNSQLTAALSTKADTSTVNTALAAKTDKSDIAGYVDVTSAGVATGNSSAANATALNAIIISAAAAGKGLYWPNGTYNISNGVSGLHSVPHTGPGKITLNGTISFWPAGPPAGQTNTFYVSTTGGASTITGLSAAEAFNSIQSALNAIANYPTLPGAGSWEIQIYNGTYTKFVFPTNIVSPDKVLVIRAQTAIAHPTVPSVIITNGYNHSGYGLNAQGPGVDVQLKDILFTGYNGSTASQGVQWYNTPHMLYLINVHFTDCYWGVSSQVGNYDVKGGIFTRCGYLGDTANTTTPITSRNGNGGGCRSLMLTRHSIGTQNAGNNNLGPVFSACKSGVFIQESSTGHVDWCTFNDCEIGIQANVNGRANVDGSLFQRNLTVDLRGQANSVFYISSNTQFGTGANESASKIQLLTGAQIVDEQVLITSKAFSYAGTYVGFDTARVNQTVTATTATTVWSAVLAAVLWKDPTNSTYTRKKIRIRIVGTLTGTTTNKRINVRLGTGLTQLVFTSTDSGAFACEATIYFTDSAEQVMYLEGARHLAASVRSAKTIATNPLTAATTLSVEGQVDAAGDSILFDVVDVEVGV